MKQSQIKDYTSPKAHYWPEIVPASGSMTTLRLLVIHCAIAFPLSLLKKPAELLTPASPTPVSLEPGPHFVISQPSPCVPFSFFNSQKLSRSLWPVTLFLRFTSWHAHSWGLSHFIALQSPLQKVTTLSVIYCFYVQEPTKSSMSFINIHLNWNGFRDPEGGYLKSFPPLTHIVVTTQVPRRVTEKSNLGNDLYLRQD